MVFRFLLCFFFSTIALSSKGQSKLLPLSHDLELRLGKHIYIDTTKKSHPAIKPHFDVDFLVDKTIRDSLSQPWLTVDSPEVKKSWLYRKLFSEHLVEVNNDEYTFHLDFLPDFQIGRQGNNTLWLNTRGVEMGGTIGKQFAFTSYLFENQGRFAKYYTDFVNANKVVPGQGRSRPYGDGGFDYGYSGGTLSYTPSKYVNLQLGYDKNFIGDGYRSLLLSDNSFNYPFFKVTASVGSVRYMAMFAQFIDFYEHDFSLGDNPFPKKYGVFHYLSWNATKRLNVGLFENVMWQPRGFEFSYMNPFVFARPVEFANGSPDKMLLGINASYKIADRYVAYGQFMLNEFRGKDFFSGKGHWATKHGQQIGIKGFDVFKVSNLSAQVELNTVRPYSYSSLEHFTNYGHYNQALAHPYGANFREFVAIANYKYHRFNLRLQLNSAMYGLDENGLNYGKEIFRSYNTRVSDEGIFTGNGLRTNLLFFDTKLAYVLNPKNNLRIEFGYAMRNESNSQFDDTQHVINIGLRASFRNLYADF